MSSTDVHGGGTFTWTPAACAGARAGIDLLTNGETLPNVAGIEQVALEIPTPLMAEIPQVGDVRALGALIGVEFVTDAESITPAPAFHRAVHLAALERGILGIAQWGNGCTGCSPP